MEKYQFVAQNDLDALKKELVNYVNSIIDTASKLMPKKLLKNFLEKHPAKIFL